MAEPAIRNELAFQLRAVASPYLREDRVAIDRVKSSLPHSLVGPFLSETLVVHPYSQALHDVGNVDTVPLLGHGGNVFGSKHRGDVELACQHASDTHGTLGNVPERDRLHDRLRQRVVLPAVHGDIGVSLPPSPLEGARADRVIGVSVHADLVEVFRLQSHRAREYAPVVGVRLGYMVLEGVLVSSFPGLSAPESAVAP